MITIPSISQLFNSVKSALQAELNVTIPDFGPSFLRTFAIVYAGKLKQYYLAIAKVQKNIFVDTAEPEASGGTLERFGRVKLGRNPFPAVAGQYSITVTGDVGAVIPAQSTFKADDSTGAAGQLYILDTDYTLVSTSDTITVRALTAGLAAKLLPGDSLTAAQPIALVDSAAIVSSEVVQPLAAESLEEYRQKAILAYQLEPQGGAASDYILWSLDAQGVRRVYPYAKSGESAVVDVFIEATIDDSSDGKGTPGAAILEDVVDVIEFDPDTSKPLYERGRRPLGAFEVNVLPITVLDIDVVVTGFEGLTAEIESVIEQALISSFDNIRPFVSAANVLANKNDILSVNKLIFIIQEANPSSVFDEVQLFVDGVEYGTYQFTQGEIPFLNTLTIS